MKNIEEGIGVGDIQKARGTELMSLFGELIVRAKFGEEHKNDPANDAVLFQSVWDELEKRLKCYDKDYMWL